MDKEARDAFDAKIEAPEVPAVNGRPVPEGVDPEEQARVTRQLQAIFQMPQQ